MSNKKIGIATITIKDAHNYGNKLQTYALQKFLQQNGYEVETIRYEAAYIRNRPPVSRNMRWKNLFSQSLAQSLDDAGRILRRRMRKKKLMELHNKRKNGFDLFDRKNIKYTEEMYCHDSSFADLRNRYDCFVTGSDQVWNPYYEGMDPFFYLAFAEKGKRISYAPSIAVEQIPQAQKSDMEQWIRDMDYISIREARGKEMLAGEFGIDAELVCDPVFLLSREQWKTMTSLSSERNRYFVVYLLGKKTVETKKKIRKLEAVFGIPAVDIYNRDDPDSVFATPEEFLGLIEKAQFVLTDSFHGTAFSVIFQVPVVTLNRYAKHKMDSRIVSLLDTIAAGDRSADYILENTDRLAMEYKTCKDRLIPFVESSKKYLLSAIKACTESD